MWQKTTSEKKQMNSLGCRVFPISPNTLLLLLLKKMKHWYVLAFLTLISSCRTPAAQDQDAKALIIETLQLETQYFCERNLGKWEEQWARAPFVSKMYLGNTSFTEFKGWEEIRQNTLDHIRDYPDPIPIPVVDQEYTVNLFKEAALVFYAKEGEVGPIREIRFMVREGEKWKIARMQTIH